MPGIGVAWKSKASNYYSEQNDEGSNLGRL